MKKEIVTVTIGVEADESTSGILITRTRNSDGEVYPLTERNYWRAVGMQLRLSGFPPSKRIREANARALLERLHVGSQELYNPLDKAHYKEGEG